MFMLIVVLVAAFIVALFTVPQLKGLRTQITGAVIAIGGGLVPLLSDIFTSLQAADWQKLLGAKEAAATLLVLGVLVIIFRHLARPKA